MAEFQIYPTALKTGIIALSPIPGLTGDFAADMDKMIGWQPALVFSMTTQDEMRHHNATDLSVRLFDAGIGWLHLPIEDFGAPMGETALLWPVAAASAHKMLDQNRKVLIHCQGGQGRSGMAALRLMVERGVPVETALGQLRKARPGAVETEAQLTWASSAETSVSPGF